MPGPVDLGPLYHAGHIASPLRVGDVLYDVNMMGLVTASDVRDGKQHFRRRLDKYTFCNRQAYGACPPALGGQYVFITENTGGMVILQPGTSVVKVTIRARLGAVTHP